MELLLSLAQGVATTLHSSPDPGPLPVMLYALLVALLGSLLSPLPWLLLGAARRRDTEKLAALLLGIALALSLLGTLTQLLPPRPGAAPRDPVRPVQQINILQNLFFLLLIVTWPVLSRPVLEKKISEENG